MARVALREKMVVGLMMEGVSLVSMVVVTGWVVVYKVPREIWKGRKSSRMVEYVNDIQTLGDAT